MTAGGWTFFFSRIAEHFLMISSEEIPNVSSGVSSRIARALISSAPSVWAKHSTQTPLNESATARTSRRHRVNADLGSITDFSTNGPGKRDQCRADNSATTERRYRIVEIEKQQD